MKVLLLNYLKYDFTNKDTGQVVQGVNLHCLTQFNLNDYTVGMEVSKYSLTLDNFNMFHLSDFTLPCLVDLEVLTGNTLKGKPVSKIVNIEFIRSVDLKSLFGDDVKKR